MQRFFFKQRKQSLGSSHGNQLSHSRIILGTDFKEERPLGAKRFPEAAPPPSHLRRRRRRRHRRVPAHPSCANLGQAPPAFRAAIGQSTSRRLNRLAKRNRAKKMRANFERTFQRHFSATFFDFERPEVLVEVLFLAGPVPRLSPILF